MTQFIYYNGKIIKRKASTPSSQEFAVKFFLKKNLTLRESTFSFTRGIIIPNRKLSYRYKFILLARNLNFKIMILTTHFMLFHNSTRI